MVTTAVDLPILIMRNTPASTALRRISRLFVSDVCGRPAAPDLADGPVVQHRLQRELDHRHAYVGAPCEYVPLRHPAERVPEDCAYPVGLAHAGIDDPRHAALKLPVRHQDDAEQILDKGPGIVRALVPSGRTPP